MTNNPLDQFITGPNELSQWHSLVQQAEQNYGCQLEEPMESYLVFTLMRFMRQPTLGAQALALDYLEAQNLPRSIQLETLRDIGDQCLILSGLFPHQAQKRLVRVSYYVKMGRSAYQHIGAQIERTRSELYHQLAETFVLLMDMLQTIREFTAPALQPIQAYELWSDTGSQRARAAFGETTPLHESLINAKLKQ